MPLLNKRGHCFNLQDVTKKLRKKWMGLMKTSIWGGSGGCWEIGPMYTEYMYENSLVIPYIIRS